MSEQYSSILEGLLLLKRDITEIIRAAPLEGKALEISNRIFNYLNKIWFNQGTERKLKNQEYKDKTKNSQINTIKMLKHAHNPIFEDLVDALLNVFYRLTSYSSGSMVSLYDLIDLHTAKYMCNHIDTGANDDFSYLRNWKLVVEGLIFTLYCMDIKLPAPYYPGLAVLEKKDTLQQALIDLENSFKTKTDKTL